MVTIEVKVIYYASVFKGIGSITGYEVYFVTVGPIGRHPGPLPGMSFLVNVI